jgi:hypothetical protein
VKLGEAAKLFLAGVAWRLGIRSAGRTLAAGLSSTDEDNRLIAGMLLVRGGKRAIPLLNEELRSPRNLPLLLRVMGDVAPNTFRDTLERYSRDEDPKVSRAAKDALRAAPRA